MGEVYISVVEYGVRSYPHEGMVGWNFMRIEYWDTEESYAFLEHHCWMPPGVTSAVLEDWMNEMLEKSE